MHTHTAHTIAKLENVVPGKNRAPDDAEMRSQHWAISQPQKGDDLSGGGQRITKLKDRIVSLFCVTKWIIFQSTGVAVVADFCSRP